MRVFRVVADSSCLIGLAQIELFGLLKELFLEVYIPRAVYVKKLWLRGVVRLVLMRRNLL